MKPVICIPGDNKINDGLASCAVYRKYIEAVVEGAEGIPWVLPADATLLDNLDQVLSRVDGILLTGSLSNIEPHHYAGPASTPGTLHDPERDSLTFALIQKALALGVPILGICRGFQELNVAMGGSLHQQVHQLTEMLDHREDTAAPAEVRYGPSHEVTIEPGGVLERLMGCTSGPLQVNSLHGQGIDRLGDRLFVEARAPDGLVEAISVKDAKGYALAVQWHPEWEFHKHRCYQEILRSFSEACHKFALSKLERK